MNRHRVCAAKLGEPGRMRECGKPIRFLLNIEAAVVGAGTWSGWYHGDPEDDRTHWPVPRHEI